MRLVSEEAERLCRADHALDLEWDKLLAVLSLTEEARKQLNYMYGRHGSTMFSRGVEDAEDRG